MIMIIIKTKIIITTTTIIIIIIIIITIKVLHPFPPLPTHNSLQKTPCLTLRR